MKGNATKAISVAQSSVFSKPSLLSARRDVASLILKQGKPMPAFAILSAQENSLDHEREALGLKAVAETGSEAVRLAQKAVKISPWEIKNWEMLAYVRSTT
jgi:superkiller protein 3